MESITVIVDLFTHKLTYWQDGKRIRTLKIAVGKPATPSPIGVWHVMAKYQGWGGGFGTHFLALDVPWGIYGIHGTNKPNLVGKSVSLGCIRMRNEDVNWLYHHVNIQDCIIIEGNPLGHAYRLPRHLAEGERGSDVLLVQNRLRAGGWYRGRQDGIFADDLLLAVLRFQRKMHVPVDGMIDRDDYLVLGLLE